MLSMRSLIILAALSGFSAVLLGAMGSHFLSPYMTEKGPALFRTANLYHLFHSLALLATALLYSHIPGSKKLIELSALCFMLGILLFSGIIYYLALTPGSVIHFIVPVGGMLFMAGWIFLGLSGLSLKK